MLFKLILYTLQVWQQLTGEVRLYNFLMSSLLM